jgi:hypothetical protein
MDFSKTSTAEAYARKIRKLRKKDLDPMSGMDAKQMNTVGADPDGNRLDTWKEIAVYLGGEARTAQRWQKTERLPVHRHFHARACCQQDSANSWVRCAATSSSDLLRQSL